MKKKFVILAAIILICLVGLLLIVGFDDDIFTEDDDVVDVVDDQTIFLGTWDDLLYGLDDKTSSEWNVYDNNSMKITTSGFTYKGESKTEVDWYSYKFENSKLCFKFDPAKDYICYKYSFSNSDDHLSLDGENSNTEWPTIFLNRIK